MRRCGEVSPARGLGGDFEGLAEGKGESGDGLSRLSREEDDVLAKGFKRDRVSPSPIPSVLGP